MDAVRRPPRGVLVGQALLRMTTPSSAGLNAFLGRVDARVTFGDRDGVEERFCEELFARTPPPTVGSLNLRTKAALINYPRRISSHTEKKESLHCNFLR